MMESKGQACLLERRASRVPPQGVIVKIREWEVGEEVSAITEMLHRAYAVLAEMGLHYAAVDQGDEVTRQRMGKDVSWLAEEEGVLLGTIALCPWTSLSEPAEAYQRPGLWLFHQFGVEPTHQRRGIGSQLLEVAEDYVRRKGASELACDTAVSAGHLISLYERKGFQIVGKAAFEDTNYESVILAKTLEEEYWGVVVVIQGGGDKVA